MTANEGSTSPRYLTLVAAARLAEPPIPVSTLRYWLATGRLRRCGPGRRVYIDRQQLLDLLAGGRCEAALDKGGES